MTKKKMAVEELLEKRTHELVRSEARFYNIIENNADGIVVVDHTGTIQYLNPAAEFIMGKIREELVGKPFVYSVRQDGVTEVDMLLADGQVRVAELRVTESAWEGEDAQLISIRDITEKKILGERVQQLLYYDLLTGLPNQSFFLNHLRLAIAQARHKSQMVAVLYLHLDRLKNINDTYGHHVGDQLLHTVAERLKENLRSQDILARVGGNEFALLLTETNADDVAQFAEQILDKLRQPWMVINHHLYISGTIGSAMYPNHGDDAEKLLKNAYTAMHRAEEKGTHTYQFYAPAMYTDALHRLETEANLRRALEENEFVLHYQPQVNICTGKVIGVEALLRWNHPERGLIYPNDFIPIAEDTGLIVPIGEWTLHTACQQNKLWQDQGIPPVTMAVNLSARQFQQPTLVENIKKILSETGLDPTWLELEITESIAMQNVEFTIKTLHELTEMGIRFALDDFGTGFCSLGYLKYFPVSKLKIDRSFTRDITSDPDAAAIVTTIAFLAQNLKLKVVAEGVELQDQVCFLQKQQCIEMQGYLFGRPVPPSDIKWL
jgi:diguanylate cyclase (GGDEF)-like protein